VNTIKVKKITYFQLKIKGSETKRIKKNFKFLIMSYVTTPGNGTICSGHQLRIYIWHQSLL